MQKIEREVERMLTRLRNVIRERGFTQLEVQEALGWGRSYISQLLTKQKSLRVEQVLMILSVVNVEPAEFFGELYELGEHASPSSSTGLAADDVAAELRRLGMLFEGLVGALKKKKVISASDLGAAIKKASAAL